MRDQFEPILLRVSSTAVVRLSDLQLLVEAFQTLFFSFFILEVNNPFFSFLFKIR